MSRAFSLRAIAIGCALSAAAAWLTPWNDWFLHNAYLYNNHLPPIVTGMLLVFALAINPLLGARRLVRGEMIVITSMLLVVGGVASSGLARYWPLAVVGPSRHLVHKPELGLERPLADDARGKLREHGAAAAADDHARHDGDGDGRLDATEAYGGAERIAADDRDGDGRLDRDEYVAGRLARDPAASADAAIAMPSQLFIAIPPAGPITSGDPEFAYVVDGYHDGERTGGEARVVHRSRVTWRGPDGAVREQHALAGAAREQHASSGVLDLESPIGKALAGSEAGAEAACPGGTAIVLAIERPAPVPWYAWVGPALAWAPLIIGMIVASIAAAFLVRQQWLHHERLQYPIAGAAMSLLEDPGDGRRLPPVMRTRAFQIAFLGAFAVVSWRGLHALGFVPLTFALELDISTQLGSKPWTDMLYWWRMSHPQLYLSMIGIAFLIPLELSFSVWAFFIAANLATMWLRSSGYEIQHKHPHEMALGGFIMIAPLILWIGRRWYIQVALAALGLRRDAVAREAAPWLWAVVAGLVAMIAWLTAYGTPFPAALAVVLVLFAALLVAARMVAEGGMPHIGFPASITDMCFFAFGFGLPVAAMMPIAMIGATLSDPREALLPYAINASRLAHDDAVPARRLGPILMAVASTAAVIAIASMLWHAYTGSGFTNAWRPSQREVEKVAWFSGLASESALDEWRTKALWGYALGAVIVLGCGVGRMALAWWPLHPLGMPMAISYPGSRLWASFLVAWAIKAAVMRYGGVGVYKMLVPAAIGLIAGESLSVCVFGLTKIIATGIFGETMEPYVYALPN
ncbi:MAG TPA: DUF6785 family protein [Planctomycetota bacterium]|nr:DUF6785 family protein [Planctomycetota bacterium]